MPYTCISNIAYVIAQAVVRYLSHHIDVSNVVPCVCLQLRQFRFPRVSFQDKVLHSVFLVTLLLMIGCAIATVMCFLSDKGQVRKLPRNNVELTTEEIVTLSCGIVFFVSFFVAMSVEIKAKHTVYQLFRKFIYRNMEWKIDQYDRSKDTLYMKSSHLNNRNANSNNNNNSNSSSSAPTAHHSTAPTAHYSAPATGRSEFV